jgi:hypothetical protein
MATNDDAIATYLQDHLVGADSVLDLVKTLRTEYAQRPVGRFLTSLEPQLVWERERLHELAERFPPRAAFARRLAAWFGETGFEWKLAMDASAKDEFRLLEALEVISLGIAGKRLLWRVLERRAKAERSLAGLPYRKLSSSAARQRRELEPFRLEAARLAFGPRGRPRARAGAKGEKAPSAEENGAARGGPTRRSA